MQALHREIREELDADIRIDKFLHTVEWDYPDFHLTMHCYMCSLVADALHLNEHEAARFSNSSLIFSNETWPQNSVKCLFESYIFQIFA